MKAAIVGAGVGGLVTALLLRRQGLEVDVYEKEARAGGRLGYEEDGTGRFRIDQGPTIVLLPDLLRDILVEAGVPPEAIELTRVDPLYDFYYPDGTRWTKHQDAGRQEQELEAAYAGGGADFRRYMRDMEGLFDYGFEAFLSRTFSRPSSFLTPANLRFLLRSRAWRGLRPWTSAYFRDERIRDAYSLQSLYIGGSPLQAPALYGLIPYSEHKHGIWYVKGGYGRLAEVLEQACRSAGVRVHLSCPVESVQVEQGRCTGLTAAGERRTFDAVVYNGDYPGMAGLLDGWRSRPKRYQPSSGCLLVYLGLDRRWEEAGAHQFFLPERHLDHMEDVFRHGRFSQTPSFYAFNPVAVDSDAARPGESVLYVLIPVPADERLDWEGAGAELVERVLERAEALRFPGLREAIRWRRVRTPREAARSGLYRGGSFGIAPVLGQSGGFRPQVKPLPIERLYAVGASVHPGGGIPIVMQGARLLGRIIAKELGT
ncbi:phytoene desaturase [Paenibacillus albicereus]|uniref:Phytoene desaturase n=1 Tax=Paenibacillus albicereus TaxID=2726185 RepID=A0A6H2H2Q5_9BACL|nr:phytoene desaturase family protein [Paenibacillus albicereus]QJC53960.1 phytoene desaturase [Paenibacillus albicereus]